MSVEKQKLMKLEMALSRGQKLKKVAQANGDIPLQRKAEGAKSIVQRYYEQLGLTVRHYM